VPKKSGTWKKPKEKLTLKQSRFAKAFMKTRSLKEAALAAGYSPKNPTESGIQALNQIKDKAPEVMARAGLTLDILIRKHLAPLLEATETKFSQHEGEFTDSVETADNGIRLGAARTAFELLNAFPPKDPALAAQVGISVVVLDIPRPDRAAINVTPAKKRVETSGNGHKPVDPRPQD
jgi:hypothetical protein